MAGKWEIEPDKTLSKSEDMDTAAKKMKSLADEIVACRNHLAVSGNGAEQIKQTLARLHEKAMDEAAHMEHFGDALRQMVQLYSECENRIAGQELYAAESEENSTGTEKRGFFKRFWDWICGNDPDTKYTATSDEQERAADREFQEQISALMESDRFSEERWDNASVEERKQMLEDYMNEVADILGVDVRSQVDFINKAPEDGKILMGQYSHDSRTVSINSYVLENRSAASSYVLFTTIVHELRHAYQHSAVDHPDRYRVSKETIDSWKESFRTYGKEQKKGYDSYRNIVVEQDARAFAGQS